MRYAYTDTDALRVRIEQLVQKISQKQGGAQRRSLNPLEAPKTFGDSIDDLVENDPWKYNHPTGFSDEFLAKFFADFDSKGISNSDAFAALEGLSIFNPYLAVPFIDFIEKGVDAVQALEILYSFQFASQLKALKILLDHESNPVVAAEHALSFLRDDQVEALDLLIGELGEEAAIKVQEIKSYEHLYALRSILKQGGDSTTAFKNATKFSNTDQVLILENLLEKTSKNLHEALEGALMFVSDFDSYYALFLISSFDFSVEKIDVILQTLRSDAKISAFTTLYENTQDFMFALESSRDFTSLGQSVGLSELISSNYNISHDKAIEASLKLTTEVHADAAIRGFAEAGYDLMESIKASEALVSFDQVEILWSIVHIPSLKEASPKDLIDWVIVCSGDVSIYSNSIKLFNKGFALAETKEVIESLDSSQLEVFYLLLGENADKTSVLDFARNFVNSEKSLYQLNALKVMLSYDLEEGMDLSISEFEKFVGSSKIVKLIFDITNSLDYSSVVDAALAFSSADMVNAFISLCMFKINPVHGAEFVAKLYNDNDLSLLSNFLEQNLEDMALIDLSLDVQLGAFSALIEKGVSFHEAALLSKEFVLPEQLSALNQSLAWLNDPMVSAASIVSIGENQDQLNLFADLVFFNNSEYIAGTVQKLSSEKQIEVFRESIKHYPGFKEEKAEAISTLTQDAQLDAFSAILSRCECDNSSDKYIYGAISGVAEKFASQYQLEALVGLLSEYEVNSLKISQAIAEISEPSAIDAFLHLIESGVTVYTAAETISLLDGIGYDSIVSGLSSEQVRLMSFFISQYIPLDSLEFIGDLPPLFDDVTTIEPVGITSTTESL